ncbi:MAG: hypothetical protein IKQ91_06335 [Oscillospiraceae bacterium]|nr:hypothetical protein [Oscillospiraceae bacterium]
MVITVADNGTADKDNEEEKRTHHGIGLDNTRKRLELQCSGTLDMENSLNGTIVTITIPQ